MIEELNQSYLWPVVAALAGGIGSFFIGLLLERYKKRRLELTQSITFQKIGLPDDSYLQGRVHISYEGNSANNLYVFRVVIKNDSNFDAQDLPINIYLDANSYMLSYSCPRASISTILMESANYSTRLKKYFQDAAPFLEANQNAILPEWLNLERIWLMSSRELVASALNRNEEIEITVLVASIVDNQIPILNLKIPTAGVIVSPSVDTIKENERLAKICFLIGIVLTVSFGAYFAFPYNDESPHYILLSIIGALNFFIALAFYKAVSFVHSYFK